LGRVVESTVTVDDLRALRRFLLRQPLGRRQIRDEYLTGATIGFFPYFVLAIAVEN
jgi:hypothetical protein